MMMRARPALLALALVCCAPAVRPIPYGTEPCAHCHMVISDRRFAAELVSRKGRAWFFDDPTCLATFYVSGDVKPEDVALIVVNDFVTPDSTLDARAASYLQTPRVETPMGGGIIALRAGREADSVQAALGGSFLTWDQLRLRPATR